MGQVSSSPAATCEVGFGSSPSPVSNGHQHPPDERKSLEAIGRPRRCLGRCRLAGKRQAALPEAGAEGWASLPALLRRAPWNQCWHVHVCAPGKAATHWPPSRRAPAWWQQEEARKASANHLRHGSLYSQSSGMVVLSMLGAGGKLTAAQGAHPSSALTSCSVPAHASEPSLLRPQEAGSQEKEPSSSTCPRGRRRYWAGSFRCEVLLTPGSLGKRDCWSHYRQKSSPRFRSK